MALEFCVPCLFGLEGLCADELKRLNMDEVRAENGRVMFLGGRSDIARANINLRTGERVMLVIGETKAGSFDELFEGVRAMTWERYIPEDGTFPVKGFSLGSNLHSIPDCQKIVKKAIVERLKDKYKTDWFKETGAKYQIQFAIMKDTAILYIDTSGAGLHKRGYRPSGNKEAQKEAAQGANQRGIPQGAPLRETLAAAIVNLSRYKGREMICDPFCGSGTLTIEAALTALNRAPGLNRIFAAQKWDWLENSVWNEAREEAVSREFKGTYDIWGGDIDPKCVETAAVNAKRAGVSEHIKFQKADASAFSRDVSEGTILTNPPYGERIMQKSEAEEIYRKFGAAVKKLDSWKMYILSSHTEFERTFGKRAVKKRKLYNGMIKCDLFMYY